MASPAFILQLSLWLDTGSGIFPQARGHRGSGAWRGPAGVQEPGGELERSLAR